MSELRVRKELRLKDYDYSQAGCYFITICVKDGYELLCSLDVGDHSALTQSPENSVLPRLTEIGEIIGSAIGKIPLIYKSVKIDNYVIIIHMILTIESRNKGGISKADIEGGGNDGSTLCSPTVSRIIKQLKEYVTKQIGYSIWQLSFYDHIIRDEAEYQRIWHYVDNNPSTWQSDRYFKP